MKSLPLMLERILLGLWIGGVWAIGYLAAPVLFAVLDDRQLAGRLAGVMFQIIGYVGLVCGVSLLFLMYLRSLRRRRGSGWRQWLLVAVLAAISIILFVIQPDMAALKAQGIVPGSETAAQFGLLHGLSSGLYLFVALSGLVLLASAQDN